VVVDTEGKRGIVEGHVEV